MSLIRLIWDRCPIRGALINALAVLIGSLLGLGFGSRLPGSFQEIALSAIALVTLGMSIKMFLSTKNILITATALVLGGLLGKALGFDIGLLAFSNFCQSIFGGSGSGFNEGLMTSFVLFCVGPMTLMGCMQDGLERKLELLGLKSILDGMSSVFLATATASFGNGVLISAILVLVVQSSLTLLSSKLRVFAQDEEMIGEATAVGGAILLAIGLSLLKIASVSAIPKEVFLPALILAPLFSRLSKKFQRKLDAS